MRGVVGIHGVPRKGCGCKMVLGVRELSRIMGESYAGAVIELGAMLAELERGVSSSKPQLQLLNVPSITAQHTNSGREA